MRGNKTSCYFLTKVQTCTERNLAAAATDKDDQVADVKPPADGVLRLRRMK